MAKAPFPLAFPSQFLEEEGPIASYLQQETAYSRAVLAAAQRSRKVAARELAARLAGQAAAQLPGSSPAQHPILFPRIAFPATLLTNAAPKGFRLVQSGGCKRSLSSAG